MNMDFHSLLAVSPIDGRYAAKTAERIIYGLVGAICLAFVLAMWELIKK